MAERCIVAAVGQLDHRAMEQRSGVPHPIPMVCSASATEGGDDGHCDALRHPWLVAAQIGKLSHHGNALGTASLPAPLR